MLQYSRSEVYMQFRYYYEIQFRQKPMYPKFNKIDYNTLNVNSFGTLTFSILGYINPFTGVERS